MSGWSRRRVAGAVLGWAAVFVSGCQGPGARGVDPADARRFGPIARPADFDPLRAEMALADIPDPPEPPESVADAQVELPRQALRRLTRARELYAEGRFEAAITEADDALAYHAHIQQAHRLKALACHWADRPRQAQTHAEQALALKPDDAVCHWLLGRLARQAGDTREALRCWRLALACAPEAETAEYVTLARHDLGRLLVSEGYLAAGAAQLERFFEDCVAMIQVDRAPTDPELADIVGRRLGPTMRELSRAYGWLGRYGAAADTLSTAVRSWPDDRDLRAEWIAMLVRSGRLGEADAAARQFMADCGGCAESLDLFVALHRYTGRPARAVAVLAEAREQEPQNTVIALAYVDALLAAGRRGEAIEELDGLVSAHPELTAVRWKLVTLSRTEQRWSHWLEAMARQLQEQPDQEAPVREELAAVDDDVAAVLLDERLDDPEGLRPRLLPAIAREDPARPALDYLLARMADRLGREQQTERLLRSAVETEPAFVPAVALAAERHIARRRWTDAVELLEPARRQLSQPSAAIELLRGQCFDGLDAIDEAEECYLAAGKLDPSDKRPLALLAKLYERTDRPDEAVEAYEAIVSIDSRDLSAREGIVRLLWSQVAQTGQVLDVVEQVTQMQEMAPEALPTQRCLALVRYLRLPVPNLAGYAGRLEELLEKHPEDTRTRAELIKTLMALRAFDEAERHVELLLRIDPLSIRGNEARVLVSMRQLKFEQAIAQVEPLVVWYPNRVSYLTELAQLKSFVLDDAGAVRTWRRVLELAAPEAGEPPDEATLTFRGELITVCRHAGRFDEARALAQSWLEAVPDTTDEPQQVRARRQARFFLLAIDAAAGAHETYLKRLDQWRAEEPDDRELRAWLVGAESALPADSAGMPDSPAGLVALERYDAAAVWLLGWYQDDPGQEAWRDGLVEVLQAADRHEEAIELVAARVEAAEDVTERVAAQTALRDVYRRAGRFDAMVTTAREAIGEVRKLQVDAEPARQAVLESFLFDQQRALAGLLAVAGQFDEATTLLEDLIDQMTEWRQRAEQLGRQTDSAALRLRAVQSMQQAILRETALLRMLSYVQHSRGDVEGGLAQLRRAYGLVPDDVGLNNDYGFMLADATRDLDEAERMVRLAVAVEPTQPAYLDSWAWVLYKRERFEEALTWMRRALALSDRPDPEMHEHLGDILWRLGDREEAARAWRAAVKAHARQVALGMDDGDRTSLERAEARLTAVAGGQRPPLAETQAETRPAP